MKLCAALFSAVLALPAAADQAFSTPQWLLALRADTQTLSRLTPVDDPAFDFTPSNRAAERHGNGYAHVGDLNLLVRGADGRWQEYSSSQARQPIRVLRAGRALAAADISASFGAGLPLTVERRWLNERGTLVLRFTLHNRSTQAVEIGGLGMPMVFDNIITDRTLEQAHASASFADPYIGRDAGYVQVTRLNGHGPALLVLPDGRTPLEAWRPIADNSKRAQTAEGFYDWTVASKAYAETDWQHAGTQWNAPTSFTLAPGARREIGLRFVTAPSIRAIETTLIRQQRPVAVGIPGYVVPTDMEATLFLHSPQKVLGMRAEPADALTVTPAAAPASAAGWQRYAVRSHGWGPARLNISYADGSVQTVSYFVTKPLVQAVADLGRFATTAQWFDDRNDPFQRAPAILTYDNEARRIVTDDPRVWISGMSDEGGAGSWVAAIMKQLDNPDAAEVAKLERLVNDTVVGKLQVADGPQAGAVRKSLFYYDPQRHPGYYDPSANWSTWTSWSAKDAADPGRAYNYPHVAIGHWVLYRLARNHDGLVTAHDWRWYLLHAYQTVVAMERDAPEYAQFGLMEGDVFVDILKDLQREGMQAEAADMQRMMKRRADHWRTLAYPFGSEMAWDSTGQAEVYAWMRYFGYQPQADITREVILGYDPAMPSWGYNGNARRYWDFLYGGKTARIERQIHHYGSTLNAVPLFDAYRANPADLHLLRVAYGGLMGGITNIDQQGFASAAFHAWPDMMRWDAYSGDYGMGFYGHAYASASYVLQDPTFGWLAFGANLRQDGDGVLHITPRDSARTRMFIAPRRTWITLEAGKIDSATYDPRSGAIRIQPAPGDRYTRQWRVVVERDGNNLCAVGEFSERGACTFPLGATPGGFTIEP